MDLWFIEFKEITFRVPQMMINLSGRAVERCHGKYISEVTGMYDQSTLLIAPQLIVFSPLKDAGGKP